MNLTTDIMEADTSQLRAAAERAMHRDPEHQAALKRVHDRLLEIPLLGAIHRSAIEQQIRDNG